MENGAFFAGVAIAPDLPLIAELAVAIDVVLIAVGSAYSHAISNGRLAQRKQQPWPN